MRPDPALVTHVAKNSTWCIPILLPAPLVVALGLGVQLLPKGALQQPLKIVDGGVGGVQHASIGCRGGGGGISLVSGKLAALAATLEHDLLRIA